MPNGSIMTVWECSENFGRPKMSGGLADDASAYHFCICYEERSSGRCCYISDFPWPLPYPVLSSFIAACTDPSRRHSSALWGCSHAGTEWDARTFVLLHPAFVPLSDCLSRQLCKHLRPCLVVGVVGISGGNPLEYWVKVLPSPNLHKTPIPIH